jgi:hypothetical protein
MSKFLRYMYMYAVRHTQGVELQSTQHRDHAREMRETFPWTFVDFAPIP